MNASKCLHANLLFSFGIRVGAAFLAAVSLSLMPLAAAAAKGPPVMIVFDGSGSMWGRLDGVPGTKLANAREELVHALREQLPDTPVGLVTFGAASGGSCSSSRLALAPQTGQTDELERLLEKFNPQGRGPVVLGVRTALEALTDTSAPARILVIHDNPDNCGQNICELAKELVAASRPVTVDVLSIALKDDEAGGMACLTKATGGLLVEAASGSEVAAGITRIALTIQKALQPPEAAETAASGDAGSGSKTGTRPARNAKSGLNLIARLATSQKAIPHGIKWHIRSLEKSGTVVDRTFETPTVDLALPPGRYRVTMRSATATIGKEITVRDEPREETEFTFEGGLVHVILQEDAAADGAAVSPPPADMMVMVTRFGGSRGEMPVWTGPAKDGQTLLLESGAYRITAGNGLFQRTEIINVTAGHIHRAQLGQPLAELTVKASALQETQRAVAEITIAADDANAPGGRRILARTAAPQATFALPPGPYTVSLSAFGSETRALVVLAPRQRLTKELELEQMMLEVTSLIGGDNEIARDNVRYRVWRADDLGEPIAVSRDWQPVFHLRPGRYRIECRIGLQNAVMIREFDVTRGARGKLELRHNAGMVEFAFPGDVSLTTGNAYWQVMDDGGRLVWQSFARDPHVFLAAGTYRVTVNAKKDRYEAKFAVVSGRRQTVQLGQN
ncbi:MAG: hypothetical protein KKB37_00525 [Alphaproteobacteria bacterium]|nr:hypothetical protein [Alphaproteobacteria bacterium]